MPRLLPLVLAALLAACTQPASGARSTCKPCVADTDCGTESCIQLAQDNVCLAPCRSDGDCDPGDTCLALTSAEGAKGSFCLARDGSCGQPPDENTAPPDAGPPPDDICTRLQPPETANTCCRCSRPGSCEANNCYGGWLCDPQGCICKPQPPQCRPPNDALHAGGAITGAVEARTGGKVSRLHFAVVGDTRPAVVNDTANYPTKITDGIYGAIAKLSPKPSFVVTTGDYVFATPKSEQTGPQLDLYLRSKALFQGPLWPAFGNHECDGYTANNCGPGLGKGETSNYLAFIEKMVKPIGESKPYFMRRVDGADGKWTAKFVFVGTNSWSEAQGTWLDAQMKIPTTYTFVVRHTPLNAVEAPGLQESEAIISKYPSTLYLEGHSHTWIHRTGSKEVIIGNGGAPMTSSTPYGYTLVSQRGDGAIVVSNYDYTTGRAVFSFAVNADGTPAAN